MAGLLSLSQSPLFTSIDKRGSSVAIYPFDDVKRGLNENQLLNYSRALQYFPETLRDSKEVNYQPKDIPGASLPIYQWVSSGARTLSFTAYFSCDNDLEAKNTGQALVDRLRDVGEERRNVDIRSAIYWLRSFMLPTYETSASLGTKTIPPKKLILIIPRSGIGAAGGTASGKPQVDSVVCVMTQCEVTHESFFPSGLPRLSVVELSFAQIPQYFGGVHFPQDFSKNDPTYTMVTTSAPQSRTTATTFGGGTIQGQTTTQRTANAFFGYRITGKPSST